jgi:hypothetical protein
MSVISTTNIRGHLTILRGHLSLFLDVAFARFGGAWSVVSAAGVVVVLVVAVCIRIDIVVIARNRFVVRFGGIWSVLIWICWIGGVGWFLIVSRLFIWMSVNTLTSTREVEDLNAIHFVHQFFL